MISTIQSLSHGSLVPNPCCLAQARSCNQSITSLKFCLMLFGKMLISSKQFLARFFPFFIPIIKKPLIVQYFDNTFSSTTTSLQDHSQVLGISLNDYFLVTILLLYLVQTVPFHFQIVNICLLVFHHKFFAINFSCCLF